MSTEVSDASAGRLARESRFADPDAAFRLLAQAHRDLGERESAALNARLVLILANQIGDEALLREAVALAREAG
ncbi:DUF2783 domain-containing protein [Bosea sp. CS1GBMeth4]|uniref:DUF2783 domain-containing protein n=1 Tax=Bosea sp. CS1GBMeth4 TaxID=1892849 RepID=UPI001648DF73|nr:DUF2783 domain-containing protein [Bosea sp. CS1GBMeth4]